MSLKKSLLTVVLAACVALPAAAVAQPRTIAAGVSAGGVDLSGLTLEAATSQLAAALRPALGANVTVGAGGRAFRLSATSAKEKLDALTSAKRALYATRPGAVPLALSHARAAVRDFVIAIGRAVSRPSRNAGVKITIAHIYRLRGREGHRLDEPALAAQIDRALDSPGVSRVFHVRLRRTRPAIDVGQLAHAYGTIVTVDRAHFRLRLFKRLRFVKSYGIAVGRAGLETPTGYYKVQERLVNPAWHVPNRAWAGALAGTTVPPGPGDPLVARWLGLGDGIGIHGTNEPFSIGSAASHGCIRMRPGDVIDLYRRVPLNTPVYIR